MAELNTSSCSSDRRGRTLKSLPKVDLTAMVDLAFLLITFFMLTTSLSKPTEMRIAMPVDAAPEPVSLERSITLCLGADNILWYNGEVKAPISQGIINPRELREMLLSRVKEVNKNTGKNLFVLIKPSDRSKYKCLVDVLDELAILGIDQYAITDLERQENDLMERKHL
jgi:biopolymer transport protein ExbD